MCEYDGIRKGLWRSKMCMILLLIAPATAGAIERYRIEGLPDEGFGSRALGLDPGSAATVGEIVGEVFQHDGSSVAALWTWGADARWAVTKLPTPDGLESVAHAVAFAPLKPAEFVVGTIMRPEHESAVVWENDGTGWTVTQLPTPDGFGSRALGLDPGSAATVGEVVGELFQPNGLSAATLWTWGDDVGWTGTPLPSLGGPDTSSRASDIHIQPGGQKNVVGASQLPNGRWRATLWRQAEAGEWQAHDMGALRNAQSQASVTKPHYDGLFAVGSSFLNNGRSRATVWVEFEEGDAMLNLGAPDGFRSSSATDGMFLTIGVGELQETVILRAVGTAWTDFDIHDPGVSTGVVWSGRKLADRKPVIRSIPATALLEDQSWQPTTLSAIAERGMIVGHGLRGDPGDDFFHALVMAPSNVHMPDAMKVLRGRAASLSSVEDVWWADGRPLRIFARGIGQDRRVDAVFQYYMPFGADDPNEILIDVTIAGVTKHRRGASWQQEILLYDFSINEWVIVSTTEIGAILSSTSLTIPWRDGDWLGHGIVINVRVVVTSSDFLGRWGVVLEDIVVVKQ